METDTNLLAWDARYADAYDLTLQQRRQWRWWFLLLALAALLAVMFLVGLFVDPSAGAAGGCGGG